MISVYPILCRKGYMDNYAYLVVDEKTLDSAVIDPSEEDVIIAKCEELNIRPKFLLCTHHHFDHVDGAKSLKQRYGAKIVCNKDDAYRIEGCDIALRPDENFCLGESVARIIDVSAHTKGHVLYYFEQDKVLFTGDTLFNLCIGGLFEGTPEDMFEALNKIKNLPDDVLFYPGHEYTFGAARQAFAYNKGNADIKDYLNRARERLAHGMSVAPVALGVEKKCNPYLQAKTIEEFKLL